MHIIASGFAGDDIGIYVLFGIVFAILVVFIWMPIQSHREAKKALEKMDTPSEEPELFEQSAVVLKKHCYAEASRRDSPLHDKHFFVTFQTEDGKTVYIMVIDGRRYTYSNGMSFHDMSEVMHAVGCYSAINLDGGGSSTFFTRVSDGYDDPDRFKVLNWPTDDGGVERAIYCALVLVQTDAE